MGHAKDVSRRDFLKTSGLVAAGAGLAGSLSIARSAHAAGAERIRAVLIGCGGRGNGAIRDCLNADPAVVVVAVADAFEDRAKGTAERLRKEFKDRVNLPDDHVFVGLECHKGALAVPCDLVVMASPPGFRPMQYAAAIKAGKHVFMEKPCCVDAPGFRMLMEANELADQKGLKVGVGLQRHHQASYVETIKRIHDGAIGRIMLLRAYWNGHGIWNRKREPNMTEMQYQVHNWYHFCWLSGDNICEQHVHNLDICNWVMQGALGGVKNAHPVEANGMGACLKRYRGEWKGTGQIFDEHFVEFTYADGTKMYSQCRQIPNTFSSVSEHAHGTEGESNCSGWIRGKQEWRFSGKGENPYVQEHRDLIAAIRSGEKYNEGWYGAISSMTAVLGRMATYSGQVVKWDEAVAKGGTEFPKELRWDAPAPVQKDAEGNYPIPMPGEYKPY
jgi:myo-inositol 2-dehydrogenase/D-chiro-inositol 1-dehydrogenase